MQFLHIMIAAQLVPMSDILLEKQMLGDSRKQI
jgi:hypothetical protein